MTCLQGMNFFLDLSALASPLGGSDDIPVGGSNNIKIPTLWWLPQLQMQTNSNVVHKKILTGCVGLLLTLKMSRPYNNSLTSYLPALELLKAMLSDFFTLKFHCILFYIWGGSLSSGVGFYPSLL